MFLIEFEFENGSYVPKAPKFGGFADSPGWCALYARLASNYLILAEVEDKNGKLWNPGNVWDFSKNNKIFWDTRDKGEFNYKLLEEGDILGIKIPNNLWEEKLRHRYKFDFNHMVTYTGVFVNNSFIEPWIFHNLAGDISSQSLISFLCYTGSDLIQVFKPKSKI